MCCIKLESRPYSWAWVVVGAQLGGLASKLDTDPISDVNGCPVDRLPPRLHVLGAPVLVLEVVSCPSMIIGEVSIYGLPTLNLFSPIFPSWCVDVQ